MSDGSNYTARPDPTWLTPAQSASLHRFCTPEAARVGPTGEKSEECGFTPSRPFNGYRLAARLHPWCGHWNEAVVGKPVCETEDRDPAIPQCGALAERGFVSRNGFYCARPAVPASCGKATGLGIEAEQSMSGEILPLAERQEGFAVRGIACGDR
ncbi:MAG: hypothetical protein ABIW83_08865 [Allosphingosinicella sp.]